MSCVCYTKKFDSKSIGTEIGEVRSVNIDGIELTLEDIRNLLDNHRFWHRPGIASSGDDRVG